MDVDDHHRSAFALEPPIGEFLQFQVDGQRHLGAGLTVLAG